MNIPLHFTSGRSMEEISIQTKKYFQKQGFRLANENNNHLEFKKGSRMLNLVTMNPLKWKSHIIMILNHLDGQTTINCNFQINTSGQIVLENEKEVWNKFIENYQAYICENRDTIEQNQELVKQTKKAAFTYALWLVVGMIICGVPAIALALLTGIKQIAVPIALIGGFMIMYYIKWNRIRRKGNKQFYC